MVAVADRKAYSLKACAAVLVLEILALCGCSRSGCTCRSSGNTDARDLIWAAAMGDADVAKQLLEAGADVNEMDSHGRTTALGVAADNGSLEVAALLISKGADVNKGCPLYYAAQKGHLQIVDALLRAGADPNRFRVGRTPSPILAAARGGHIEVVRLLVAKGSELGVEDGDNSPLIAAAAGGHADVLEYLATNGDHVDIADSDGRTALYVAAANGRLEAARVLLRHGANPEQRNRAGGTPKLIAAEKGHDAILEAIEEAQQE